MKWGISIKFFKKHYLKSDLPLKENYLHQQKVLRIIMIFKM